MQASEEIQLVIAARTDPRKSPEKTLELGRKRTLAVARYLEKQGVDPSRLSREVHENAVATAADDRTRGDRVELVPLR